MSALRDEVHATFSPELSGPWKEIAKGHGAYDGEPWLRGLEKRLDPRYVLVSDEKGPAGAAVVYLFRTEADLVRIPAYYDIRSYHFRTLSLPDPPAMPPESALPMVMLGPPISGTEHRLMVRPGLSDADRRAVIRRLVERIEAIGEKIHARLVVLAHLRLERLEDVIAIRPEAIPGFVAAMMFLDLPASFEEWMGRLRGKSRWNVKNELRSLASEGMRIECRRVSDCESFLEPLYVDSLARHPEGYGDHLAEVARTTLDACIGANDQSRTFVTLKDGKPMGASLAFRAGDLYQLKLNVHDAAASRKAALYFNQVYAMIAEAIREGVKTIDFGGEANKAKLLRGCRGVPAFSAFLPKRDSPLPLHRKFLADQNRRLLAGVRRDVEEWGQYDGQADQDLGKAIAFAESFV